MLYTWGESDYRDINQIWKGANPETGEKLEVIHGMPEGTPVPDFPKPPEQFAPGIDRDDYERILKRLKSKMQPQKNRMPGIFQKSEVTWHPLNYLNSYRLFFLCFLIFFLSKISSDSWDGKAVNTPVIATNSDK